jgi:hypothetical protein
MTKITVCGVCHAELEREEQEGRDEFVFGYDGCESNNEIWEYLNR